MIDAEASLLRRWKGLRIVAISLGLGLIGVVVGLMRLVVEVFLRERH